MSNFPHAATFSPALSTSPYAVQSNLENLISRSRTNPHPRPDGDPIELPSGPNAQYYDPPNISPLFHFSRINWDVPDPRGGRDGRDVDDDDTAILLADDEDDTQASRGDDERSSLLVHKKKDRRASKRRKSYGTTTTSEPVGHQNGQRVPRRKSDAGGTAGDSRSRSTVRVPPRRNPHLHLHMSSDPDRASSFSTEYDHGNDDDDHHHDTARGRGMDATPLSPVSTKMSESISVYRGRRMSMTTRFADDSSGDEGGDVGRGLAVTGGVAMFGGRAGLGMTPNQPGASGFIDVDPADELNAVDLELPVAEDGKEVRVWSEALRAEIGIITRTSLPIFFTQLAEWSLVLASVVSIGHLGTTELAASSLASMTAAVSSFSILQGLATSLDTLLPAAWTSNDPTRVGLWTQRMSVVMMVSMIPMFMLWWNVQGVLIFLGQEPDVAAKAASYLRYLSVGIPGYGGNVVVRKYLQAQNLMHVPTYVLFICAPTNLVLNYLLVWGPDAVRLGFVGGAVATAVSYNLTFLLSLGWTLFFGPREAFHPLTFTSCFSKLGTVTSLGLAGTIMMSSEWWAWEACALAASLLGPTTLAAQSVLLSTASTFFQVPASLGIASAVRCGNLLGAGRGWEAKWASRASLFLSIAFALLNSAILIVFRKRWGYLFNSDDEVVALVADVLPFIALFQITDGVAATAGSILRSLGLYNTGALINLTSYYIIGLPFGIWLTFTPRLKLGLVGLWIGLSVALGYASVVSAVLVWRSDWTRAVERVRERLGLGTRGEIGKDGKWEDDDEDGSGDGEAEEIGGDWRLLLEGVEEVEE